MNYVNLGSSGLKVSRIALGMGIGLLLAAALRKSNRPVG